MLDMEKTLKELCTLSALSGHEDAAIDYVVNFLRPICDDIYIDKLGNVTATFKGNAAENKSIAYFAHMDELGLIVKRIEEDGFLRVERVGGVPEKAILSQLVEVFSLDGKKSYQGLIGNTSHHLTPADKKFSVTTTAELYIDLGVSTKQEVLDMGINIGSAVTYGANFTKLGDRYASKSLDDRMGVLALLALGEYLSNTPHESTVYLIFSVQEEFNIRACLPAFTRLTPDAAICIDISPACDTPELKGRYDMSLGKGVAIMYMNFHGRGTLGGLLPNPLLNQFIEGVAEEANIPIQREVVLGVITDDAFTQMAGNDGIPMAHLSIPLRYTHAPVEVADKSDIQGCIDLMCETAVKFNSLIDLRRGINIRQ